MKTLQKIGGQAILLLSGIAVFFMLYYRFPYHLLHKEQTLLFIYSSETFADYFNKPAVLSCLVGDFLTQFFLYPAVGAAIIGILLYLTGIITFYILNKRINGWVATSIAVVLIGWEGVCSCGLLHPLSSTLSLLGGCFLFWGYDKICSTRLRIVAGWGGCLLGYWLFGYGAFFFVAFLLFTSFTDKKAPIGSIVTLPLLLLAIGLSHNRYHLTYPQACSYPSFSLPEKIDPLYERLLALDFEGTAGNWKQVEQLAYPNERISACSYYYNLAAAMQEQLPDKLLSYHQPGIEGLFIPLTAESSYLSALFAGEVWFRLGDMTMAEHAYLLGMIFSPQNRGSRMIKRLAEINLINGDEAAADKYLRILSKTLFYRNWAAERTPGQQTDAVRHWLETKQKDLPQSDTIRTSTVDIVKSLRLLLAANPDNRPARDYLLCYHLLNKDIDSFIRDYGIPDGQTPKRLYAEAWMINLVRRHASGEEIKRTIVDPAVVQDFKRYTQMYQQHKDNPGLLAGTFGKTYWFYFHAAQKQ